MRVLLIANVFPPLVGGSGVVYANLCRNLPGPVEVVTPYRDYRDGSLIPGWHDIDEAQSFPVRRLELLRPRLHSRSSIPGAAYVRYVCEDLPLRLQIKKQVAEVLARFCPHVVCLGELHSLAPIGALVRRTSSAATVHFIHGEEITTPCGSRKMESDARRALAESDGLIAVSSFTAGRLLRLGVDPGRVHTILNGVDSSTFTPGPKSSLLIDRYGLSGKRVLLTVARLEERKGHDVVLTAMPRILQQCPDVVYLIVGEGNYRTALEAIVRRLGLNSSVVFAGRTPESELVDHYRLCEVFVMPNRTLPNGDTEGFGLVFLEAGACGKAVIGGVDGGAPDAVSDGETGLLVNGNSAPAVADAVTRILKDRQYADALGLAGLRRAGEADWSKRAVEFVTACDHAIARSTSRSLQAQAGARRADQA